MNGTLSVVLIFPVSVTFAQNHFRLESLSGFHHVHYSVLLTPGLCSGQFFISAASVSDYAGALYKFICMAEQVCALDLIAVCLAFYVDCHHAFWILVLRYAEPLPPYVHTCLLSFMSVLCKQYGSPKAMLMSSAAD